MWSSTEFVYINFTNYDKKNIINTININDSLENKDNELIILDKPSSINKRLNNLLDYTNEETIRIIPLDYNEFIKDIQNSYTQRQNAFEQLAKDIPRMKLYLNNHLIKDINKMNDYLCSKFDQNKVTLIQMISTQAIMAIPCEIIQRSIMKFNNHFISELNRLENYDKNLFVKIDIDDKNITIIGQKILRIAEISKDGINTKCVLKISIEIQLNNEIIFIKLSGKKNL
jgi:hypothetical protein